MSFSEKQKFAGRSVSSGDPDSGNTDSGSSGSGSTAAAAGSDNNVDYLTYRVKEGDSLWEIALKYTGVSETDISRLNNISNAKKIQPGQILKIKPKG